ncbi:MAG: hypothetical protein AAFY07_03100, partial [Pseudomonadota bacterium]
LAVELTLTHSEFASLYGSLIHAKFGNEVRPEIYTNPNINAIISALLEAAETMGPSTDWMKNASSVEVGAGPLPIHENFETIAHEVAVHSKTETEYLHNLKAAVHPYKWESNRPKFSS